MRDVYVIGAAMRRFGKFPDLSVQEMGSEVVWRAIREAQISIRDVQMAYCGHAYQGSTIGQKVLSRLGMTGTPIVNVENACASGTTAAFGIWSAIASGMIDVGIAVGVENLTRKVSGMLPLHPDDLDSSMGRVMPPLFAMIARRHMTEYGTTVEQLAKISVKNHFHGSLNP